MAEREPTCIGRVRRVLGAKVTVALDQELAGIAPIYRGRLYAIGQIGSLVRLPQGLVDLVGTVTLVGIGQGASNEETAELHPGERWLEVQLVGEIEVGLDKFQRGVSSYPSLDDPVHFATPEDLKSVFPPPDAERVLLGSLAVANNVPVAIDASKFVVRHSAIVGSTGSGKTSAAAAIVQNYINGGWAAANFVVIDPHGEYASAIGEYGSVRSVMSNDPTESLRVPFWALPADDILRAFTGLAGGSSIARRFSELVAEERRELAEGTAWLDIDPTQVTADTPIPFDIREVWYQLDRENRETRENKQDPDSVCILSEGNPASLTPTSFAPYGPAGQPPHKGPKYGHYGTSPDLLRRGLLDPRMEFLRQPSGIDEQSDPLLPVVQEWLGGTNPVSILDFSGVPSIAAEIAIGVVLNLLFEICLRGSQTDTGVGRACPVLVILEEAHRYLGENSALLAQESSNRIAREGRKYGIGLLLVTQRPTELPRTALAQCGTIIALRLTNSEDQSSVRAALPDAISGLAEALPSLRTHEAIVSGEAVGLPARVHIEQPHPWPTAQDPSVAPWREVPGLPEVGPALSAWRGTYEGDEADD